jgi:hypothetical protein
VVGCGHVAVERRDRLALCVDCFQLLLEDVRAYWGGVPDRKRG